MKYILYTAQSIIKTNYLDYFLSFLIPFKFKNKINNIDIVFQNQLLGCWIPILIKKYTKNH